MDTRSIGGVRCDPMMFAPMVDYKKLEHNSKAQKGGAVLDALFYTYI